MIKKTSRGYVLMSHDGAKKLGGPYPTMHQAVRRERQVQYFKHRGK